MSSFVYRIPLVVGCTAVEFNQKCFYTRCAVQFVWFDTVTSSMPSLFFSLSTLYVVTLTCHVVNHVYSDDVCVVRYHSHNSDNCAVLVVTHSIPWAFCAHLSVENQCSFYHVVFASSFHNHHHHHHRI